MNFLPSAIRPLLGQRFRHQAHYERVLGTALELQLLAEQKRAALQGEQRILQEIVHLEGLFSRYLPKSELNRWQQGQATLSPEMVWLLQEAEVWQERSGGVFNPAIEAVQALYRHTPNPEEDQLDLLRSALQSPLWEWEGQQARKLSPLALNFNALAKGRIADLACEAALKVAGVRQVLVNLGGDLRHLGEGCISVWITHPFSAADNAPPLARIRICNQGVATSGHTQRGSHLFDPRTARPASGIAQATVVAPDAATADVLATVLCVLKPSEGLALAERCGVGCLIVSTAGTIYMNYPFKQLQQPMEKL